MKTVASLVRPNMLLVSFPILVMLFALRSQAQESYIVPENPVALSFRNPVLIGGIQGSENAIYRFPMVTPNEDAILTIVRKSSSDITIEDVDFTGEGYDMALQPRIRFADGSTSAAADWWVEFRVDFVTKGTFVPATISGFSVTSLDMDGDNFRLNENALFYEPASIKTGTNTILSVTSVTDSGSTGTETGKLIAGTRMDFPGIDTSNSSIMASVEYNDKSSFHFRLGGSSSSYSNSTDRLYSLYFKPFDYNTSSFLLPLMLYSFDANLDRMVVTLSWTTSWEKNLDHFEMESSVDGKNFIPMVYIAGAGYTGNKTSYTLKDDISDRRASILYYRLKLVSKDGNYGYSAVRIIRVSYLKEFKGSLVAYPNPVRSGLRVTLPANWQGQAIRYELFNASGKIVKSVFNPSASQTETLDMRNLGTGFYIVRVSNGTETQDVKVIKN